jgi:hypothetical protein
MIERTSLVENLREGKWEKRCINQANNLKYFSFINMYNRKSNLTLAEKDCMEIQQCHCSVVLQTLINKK